MLIKSFLTLLAILPMSLFAQQRKRCDCDSAFSFIYKQWDLVDNMSYHSFKYERKLDIYESADLDFVIQRNPFKAAGKITEAGHRILYDPAIRKGEALYIPKGFPYTNLWLDIHGSLFRGLNHYTISNAGCNFIFGIIRNEYSKMKDNFNCQFTNYNNEKCIEIFASTDKYKTFAYTAKPRETVLDIAAKFNVLAYLLIEYNDNVSSYTEDCTGKSLIIPSHYGQRVKLVINAKHGMPSLIEVYDNKGLVERYIYTDYKFSLNLPSNYFTEEYLDDLD